MAVSLELHNAGDPSIGAEIQVLVEHHLCDRPGDWHVWIVGSRESDNWDMKVLGPNGFERSYTLAGSAGEHQPSVIGNVLTEIAAGENSAAVKGKGAMTNVQVRVRSELRFPV